MSHRSARLAAVCTFVAAGVVGCNDASIVSLGEEALRLARHQDESDHRHPHEKLEFSYVGARAVAGRQITVFWDFVRRGNQLSNVVVDICLSTEYSGCPTRFEAFETAAPGATMWNITAPSGSTEYYITFRARDSKHGREVIATGLGATTYPDRQIAIGNQSSCLKNDSGTIHCWGDNRHGQLGNGTTTSSSLPVMVQGITDAVSVASGTGFACAMRSNGTVLCWGDNYFGQLGNGTTTSSLLPVEVEGIGDAVAVAAGGQFDNPFSGYHACALLKNGNVLCWGNGANGMLGREVSETCELPKYLAGSCSPRPVTVEGVQGAMAIASGSYHNCALSLIGSVKCWGAGGDGQMGNGSMEIVNSAAVTVAGVTTAIGIAANSIHTCARFSDGTMQCWGGGGYGALGNGSIEDSALPVSVEAINDAVAIGAGILHTCAVLNNGTVKCWGYNASGQLGNGTFNQSFLPVTVLGISSATDVAGGFGHSCAITRDGSVYCWGSNASGQVGLGCGSVYCPTATRVLGL